MEKFRKKKAQTVLQSKQAKLYQEESNVKLPREGTCQVREQLAQLQKQPTSDNCMSQPITMIEAAIKQLKCKMAPGPDGVTNDMIKHLGPAAKKTLLELFDKSWKNGTVPALWKKSHHHPNPSKWQRQERRKQLPPHQPPKLPWKTSRASNQQKIDIVLGRTENTVTNTDGISETQKHRSSAGPDCPRDTECLPRKKKVVSLLCVCFCCCCCCCCCFYLTKAFDKVWREGLLLKILESGVSGRMYRWIRCFLHDRSARVKLDGYLSKSVKMREGVPQGGVISPTLFLLYINNITTVLPRHVSNTLHADDLDVWSASEYTTSSAYRIQEAVNKVEQWTNDWGLQINEVKTQATVFLPLHLQRKSRHNAWRQDTASSGDSHLSWGKA